MRARGKILSVVAGIGILAIAAQGQGQVPASEPEIEQPKVASDQFSGPNFKTLSTPIPFKVEYEFSRTVGPGRLVTAKKGVPGRIEKIYRVHFKNGKPVSKTLVETRRTEPEPELVLMGRYGFDTSRHKFTRSKVVEMNASAYDPSAGRGSRATFRTSTGLKAQYGVVAVDPKVIPMGTKLFIEGYGFAIAADKGSAIKGKRIDLCFNSRSQCFQFGRKRVRVHILK